MEPWRMHAFILELNSALHPDFFVVYSESDHSMGYNTALQWSVIFADILGMADAHFSDVLM